MRKQRFALFLHNCNHSVVLLLLLTILVATCTGAELASKANFAKPDAVAPKAPLSKEVRIRRDGMAFTFYY
jgi:hypothetical protein